MTTPAPETKCYYVSSMRIRRELIPVQEEGVVTAYRCVTYAADGPQDGDKIVADQVEFEDILIGMKLMAPRDAARMVLAGIWRGLSLDKLLTQRPPGSEPLETLLRVLK
jgi:hypothetical protein